MQGKLRVIPFQCQHVINCFKRIINFSSFKAFTSNYGALFDIFSISIFRKHNLQIDITK